MNFKISMRLGSRSKVKVTVYSQSQIPGAQWSIFRARFAECSKEQLESLPVKSVCLCVCNQWAYADNGADAVDRLLMHCCI